MVSNCTWASPARTSRGRSSSSALRNRSSAAMQSGTGVWGGGTNTAFPGRVLPIQFCEVRKSPGIFVVPSPSRAGRDGFCEAGESRAAGHRGQAAARVRVPRRSWTPPPRRRGARRAHGRVRGTIGRRRTTACPRFAKRARLPCARRSRERAPCRAGAWRCRLGARASTASSRDCCRAPSKRRGGLGGRVAGTKASTRSPATVVTSYPPGFSRIIATLPLFPFTQYGCVLFYFRVKL